MSFDERHRPTGLESIEAGRGLRIRWADGATSELDSEELRYDCPCANCVDEWTGERRFRRENAKDVGIRKVEQVGNYAFSIVFSDGHETGIFTYQRLREFGEA
jgi:DUF971 family protein